MRVFISYAWENDEYRTLVKRLAVRLRQDGIDARLDAWHLEGLTIPEFMAREVRHADKILVVCSPQYRQKIHAMEDGEHITGTGWESMLVTSRIWANLSGRKKITVVLLRGAWEEAAPDVLVGLPYFDLSNMATFEANYRELLRSLTGQNAQVPPLGRVPEIPPEPVLPLQGPQKGADTRAPSGAITGRFNAPSLPRYYVQRQKALTSVLGQLLAGGSGPDTIVPRTAIVGSWGVGKTSLAAAIAQSAEVKERFSDGILWTTLGRVPALLPLLTSWIHRLSDRGSTAWSVESASSHLRTLLYDQAVLLIVDDVWEEGDIQPFLAGGPRCAVLFTTRRAQICDRVGADAVVLHPMTPEESFELITRRARSRSLSANEQKNVQALVEQLAYIPLAIELAAGMFDRGYSWERIRSQLRQSSDRYRSEGRKQIEGCLSLSVSYLKQDDPIAWRAFVWLGLLAPDQRLYPEACATVWGMCVDDTEAVLARLADDGLVQRAGDVYSIHYLTQSMARQLFPAVAPDGLAIPIRDGHAGIVTSYQRLIPDDRWDLLPRDGYIHSHLFWHLQQAEDIDAIVRILRLSDNSGRNAWYVTREQLGDVAGFLEDVRLAHKLTAAKYPDNLPIQVLWALVVASVQSMTANITPALLRELVQRGDWGAAAGYHWISECCRPRDQPRYLIALANAITAFKPDIQNEQLQAARIKSEATQAAASLLRAQQPNIINLRLWADLLILLTPAEQARTVRTVLELCSELRLQLDFVRMIPRDLRPTLRSLRSAIMGIQDPPENLNCLVRIVPLDADEREQYVVLLLECLSKLQASDPDADGPLLLTYSSEDDRQVEPVTDRPPTSAGSNRGQREGMEPRLQWTTRLTDMFYEDEFRSLFESCLAYLPHVLYDRVAALVRGLSIPSSIRDHIISRIPKLQERPTGSGITPDSRRDQDERGLYGALSGIYGIKDTKQQAGAIIALMQFASSHPPHGVLGDLQDDVVIGTQLIGLMDMMLELVSKLEKGALVEFVEAAAKLNSEWWIVEALTLTLQRVQRAEELEAIVNASQRLKNTDLRARILSRTVVRAADFKHIEVAITCVEVIEAGPLRWDALAEIATRFATAGNVLAARETASRIWSTEDRSRTYALIVLELAAQGRNNEACSILTDEISSQSLREWVQKLINTASDRNNDEFNARVSERIARRHHVDSGGIFEQLVRSAEILIDAKIGYWAELDGIRTAAKKADASEVNRAIRDLWIVLDDQGSTILMKLVEESRPGLLEKIILLAPLIAFQGGEKACFETIIAIRDVCKWWH